MRSPGCRGRFTRRALVLKLAFLLLLAAGSASQAAEEEDQIMDGDDSACLKGLLESVREQESSSSIIRTWTAAALASPCNLRGITCNNKSRVAEISLPAANLVGTLPSSLSSCYYLSRLDMSSNALTGGLPHTLGALSLLSTLSLSNNQLTGPIPLELATCSYLTWLDLHQNQLTGSIPGQIGLLPLLYFDVSYNKLSGPIPSTLSNTSSGSPRFNSSLFAHNPMLYGFPLSPYPPSLPNSLSPPSHNPRGLSIFGILGIAFSSGIASYMIFYSLVSFLLDKYHTQSDLPQEEEERSRMKTLRRDDSSHVEDDFGWKEVLNRL